MKLLIDMNLSPGWVKQLADAGMEAEHWSTLGAVTAPDAEIMQFARLNGYIVLTHDLDFGAILATTHGEKPSVVQIRSEDISTATIGRVVISSIKQMEQELEQGALLTIEPDRTRMRLLPLRRG